MSCLKNDGTLHLLNSTHEYVGASDKKFNKQSICKQRGSATVLIEMKREYRIKIFNDN